MAALVWFTTGVALWHFTVFIPDRFWAGIVGAFLGAVIGSIFTGLLFNGFSLPSQDDTDVLTILHALPGTLAGLGVVYLIGMRQERAQAETHTA